MRKFLQGYNQVCLSKSLHSEEQIDTIMVLSKKEGLVVVVHVVHSWKYLCEHDNDGGPLRGDDGLERIQGDCWTLNKLKQGSRS